MYNLQKLLYIKGGYIMGINNEIIKVINDNWTENSEFEFVARLEELTLLDVFALMKRVKMRDRYGIHN